MDPPVQENLTANDSEHHLNPDDSSGVTTSTDHPDSSRLAKIWNQPCGPKDVLSIGLPLVISTLSFSVMQFCDRMFLSWHSELEMAAVMPAVVLNWTAAALPMGIAAYAATFVAQYVGSKREKKVGAIVWTACWLGIYSIPIFVLLSVFSREIFEAFGHVSELIPLESIYFKIACLASAAVVFESALSSFFIGRGITTIVMVVNLGSMFLNLVLDWWFIFGTSWVPEMGIEGAAWATTIAVWIKVLVYFMLVVRKPNRKRFGLHRGVRPNTRMLGRLIKYGGPNGWQMWMEGMAISIFVMFVGRIGVVEAAATTLAFSVNLIAFIPIVGLGMSVSTLVGQKIGSQEIHLAKRAVHYGMLIGLLYSAIFALFYFVTPEVFLTVYENDMENGNFEVIKSTTITLLKFVAAYCIFDCIQIIYASALKGAGDTKFVFLITIVNSILFVLFGVLGSSFVPENQELTWWWSIITLWIVGYAIVFYFRYRNGKWTKMSVIEMAKPAGNAANQNDPQVSQ